MSSIPGSQALSESTDAHDDLVAEANQRFIDNTDEQILEAIDQGRFFVNSVSFEQDADPQYLFNYYSDLGYKVSFPDFSAVDLSQQPAQQFGRFWINFWNNQNVPHDLKIPFRMIIGWDS